MILLWFKIMFYKIVKAFRTPATDAATGTETVPAPRVRETGGYGVAPKAETKMSTDMLVGFQREPGAPDDTIRTERLRRLIELGLVHEPSSVDAIRLDLLHADREARQARAQLTHDPRECPCAGRHYPSADACRWCACHRPIMASSPAKEIVVCGVCGHPDHTAGDGRCAFQVASRMQDGGFSTCRCVVALRRFCTLCDHDSHGDGLCTGYTFNERCECPGGES